MCECRLSCYCTRMRGENNLNSSWRNAGQDAYKKVALDLIVPESEDAEEQNSVALQQTWARSDVVFVSSFLRGNEGCLSSVELTYPFVIWGTCFPHCSDFSLVSSCWNLITPFSNNVNIVQLLFFSSLPRGDSLFLSEEAHTRAKTSGQIKRDGGTHSQQKQCVICFKTPNRDLGYVSKRPLNSSLAESYIFKSLK